MRMLTIAVGCAVTLGVTAPVEGQADFGAEALEVVTLPAIQNVQGDPAEDLYRQGRRELNQRS